jgi:hypothetical protein
MTFIGALLIVLAQSAADNTVLPLKNVQVLYDRAIEAVRDVSLDVPAARSWRCSVPMAPANRPF